uniref:Protein naked cuticle homolog n=1 Tax=Clastoptera arizonana TaxID=38151 RepID=A0A1B6D9M3_9HEMI
MCLFKYGRQMNDNLMANHLVRWWKTKFLNGYKQFTAVLPTDCSDGRPSDTEELLRPDSESPHPTPAPTPQQQQPPLSAKRTLNFEEVECDVSLEGDAKDRQEFSFTLYDFDGHGKITKDDIAGLVTTIYDTLGSSIKVPHYGSKTIKVKLTVSPDQSYPPDTTTGVPPAQPRRYKKNLNVTIRERRRRHHPHPRRRHSVSSSAPSEDREADVSEEEDDDIKCPPLTSRLAPQTVNARAGTLPTNMYCRKSDKPSSSLQRQELLQIIQANMEKNNLCFQTSRKQYSGSQDRERHKTSHNWDKLEKGRSRSQGQGRARVQEVPPIPRPAPASASPHHLKHRHREQEQARAMAQVVRWLEQEFSTPPRRKHHKTTPERTEHHHVHEHVHHHYHHYQDTAVLV